MRCNKARILLSASLDGELSRRERSALHRHLAGCTKCAREKLELSALAETMTLWADEEPSPWLAEKFAYKLSRVGEEERPIKSPRPRWVFRTAAAGFATVLMAVGLLVHTQVRTPQPSGKAVVTASRSTNLPKGAPSSGTRTAENPGHAGDNLPLPGNSGTVTASSSAPIVATTRPSNNKASIHNRPYFGYRGPRGNRHTMLPPAKAARFIEEKILVAKVNEAETSSVLVDNLGDAGLTISETADQVRVTLARAVDALHTVPVSHTVAVSEDDITDSVGGNIE